MICLLVEGKVGIMIPFSLPENDVCKLGTTCPIKPNTPYTASFTVPVKSEYPPVSALVMFTLCIGCQSN